MFSNNPLKRGEARSFCFPRLEGGIDAIDGALSELQLVSPQQVSLVAETPQFKFELSPLITESGEVVSRLRMERRFKDGRPRDAMTMQPVPIELQQLIVTEAISDDTAHVLGQRVAERAEAARLRLPECVFQQREAEHPLFIAGNGIVTRSYRDQTVPSFKEYVSQHLVSQVHLEQERRLAEYDGVTAYLKVNVQEDTAGRHEAAVRVSFSDERAVAWEGVLKACVQPDGVADANAALSEQVQQVVHQFVRSGAEQTVTYLRTRHDERYANTLMAEQGRSGVNGWLIQNDTHYSLIFVPGTHADRLVYSFPKTAFPMAPQVLAELLHLITNGSRTVSDSLAADQLHGLMHLHALGASVTPKAPRVFHRMLHDTVEPVLRQLPKAATWRPLTQAVGIDAEYAALTRTARGELKMANRMPHEPSRLMLGVDWEGHCSLEVGNELGNRAVFALNHSSPQIGSLERAQNRIQEVMWLFLEDPIVLLPHLLRRFAVESTTFPPLHNDGLRRSFEFAGKLFGQLAECRGIEVADLMAAMKDPLTCYGGSALMATLVQKPDVVVTAGVADGQLVDLSYQFRRDSMLRRLRGAVQEVHFILPVNHGYSIEQILDVIEREHPAGGNEFLVGDQFAELSNLARTTYQRSWWNRFREVVARTLFA